MWTFLLWNSAAFAAAIYCIAKAVIDLRARRYVGGRGSAERSGVSADADPNPRSEDRSARRRIMTANAQSPSFGAKQDCPKADIGSRCTSEPCLPALVCRDRSCAGLGVFRANAHDHWNVSALGR